MFLSESSTSVHLHSLTWQMSCQCEGCQNEDICYVRLAYSKLALPNKTIWSTIFDELESHKVTCEQLILSSPADNTITRRIVWDKMFGRINTHITLALEDQQDHGHNYIACCDSLALSRAPTSPLAIKNIVLNRLDPSTLSNSAIDTYIILKKPVLGGGISTDNAHISKVLYAAELQKKLNSAYSWKKKVYMDRCLVSAYRYLKKGITCNAGINSVHLWPSGKITACPYDANGLTVVAGNTLAEQVKNIRQSKPAIKYCDIPRLLDFYLRNNPNAEEVIRRYEYQ